jgi:hypothetical protein
VQAIVDVKMDPPKERLVCGTNSFPEYSGKAYDSSVGCRTIGGGAKSPERARRRRSKYISDYLWQRRRRISYQGRSISYVCEFQCG